MPAVRTAHPLTTAAARALTLLANYQPTSPDDAAALLSGLHEHGSDSVISGLLAALHGLREHIADVPGIDPEQAQKIADFLQAATEIMSGAGPDWIDRARELLPEPEDTSEYDGIPSWELNPAPETDPHAAPTTGQIMLSVPARLVREGDLIGGEHWRRVTYVHHDREDRAVYLTLTAPDGTPGSLEIVADVAVAVLRADTGPGVRDLARLIRDDAHAVITGAALTRSVPLHRIRQRADQILAAFGSTKEADPAAGWDAPLPAAVYGDHDGEQD